MPSPVFIIVARAAVEDRTTNILSLFSVVESLNVAVTPNPENADPVLLEALNDARRRASEYAAFAVWRREDGDENAVFEHQFSMVFPDREDPVPAAPFQFNSAMPLQRFRLDINGIPPLAQSCTIYVESRVRRPDSGEQWQQRYPILFNVQHLQEQAR
jgi:hypothetical protein